MRKIFIALCTMVSVITGNAQNTPIGENIELAGENPEELKVIYVNKDVSTHFIAMEDIKYVDISVNDIVGDIPTGNSLRIKPTKEGASGVITIVTERFFVQYMLVYSSDLAKAYTRFNIPYADLRSYMNPEVNLTKAQMYDYAHRMFISKNKFYDVSSKSNLMKIVLNNIYTLDNYFLFHDYLIAIIGLILNEFLLLVLVALPFVNEEISANTLGVSFPAPSSVELQYQPSKCVPPMIEKEEYTFSRLLEIALFCAIEPINQPVTPFGAYSIAF